MRIEDLIKGMGLNVVRGDGARQVSGLTDDSREVGEGFVFVARRGEKTDARTFIGQALEAGAGAVICEGPMDAQKVDPAGEAVWVTGVVVDQAVSSRLAERFYGEPSKKLKVIGVTGTNGKTTTAFLIQHLLGQMGLRCGLVGTVVVDDGKERKGADQTTPGPIALSRLLARMVENGCRAAAVEVSSHALDQGRVAGVNFAVGVFTNLTGDHLDYHGTMEAYAGAKAKLFGAMGDEGWAVVNADDPSAGRMIEAFGRVERVVSCRVRNGKAGSEDEAWPGCHPASASILDLGSSSSLVRMEGPWGSVQVKMPLVGRHNVYNALQALAASNVVVDLSRHLPGALEKCPAPPGRLEPVAVEGGGLPGVLVDYAHTHDALENVLLALRPVTEGKLVVLFGCGGDRDRTKRPKMAAVACRLADEVIVTSDNPRTEEPGAIIEEILRGVPEQAKGKVKVEADRERAIEMAIRGATAGDVVLLAGKGHEDYQIIGKAKRHFDDREQAAGVLRDMAGRPEGAGRFGS
ncbi:MAG: UDP-N-acetylmuramoyl-L-alanyl-D-glutamate--2,6-diaminopimelate ligase [Phycisphaeraceae bacterium]|nr:UDP-N-acetylmuramoyl-L-alanyl-D-glutamate--2,6-diaminopimelate ligase [Phycisphaeraceae bacterium]